jgi:hypothetical protein
MPKLAEQLAAVAVRAESPDGRVLATIRGRGLPVVSVPDPDDYDAYRGEGDLAAQTARAIERAVAEAENGRREAISRYSRLVVDERFPDDPRRRGFRRQRDELIGGGLSDSDLVDVSTTGLHTWQLDIRPGALRQLTASEFCSEVNVAIRDAHRDFTGQLYELKRKMFGEVGPPRRR